MESFPSLLEVPLNPAEVFSSFQFFPTSFTQNATQVTLLKSAPISRPDHGELFTATIIPLLLVHTATFARFLLEKVPAYRALGHDRQQSMAALVAVMLGKVALVAFCMPLLFGKWDSETTMSFRYAYIIQTSIYIFDMTFRKPSFALWIHHLSAFTASAYVLWYHAQYSSRDLYYLRGVTTFYTFAVGLADLGADTAMFGYYICRSSPYLPAFVQGAAHYLVALRAVQWGFFFNICATHPPENPWAFWGMLPFYVIWMREEYAEWVVISSLAKKLSLSLRKLPFERTSSERAVVKEGDKVQPQQLFREAPVAGLLVL